MPRGRLGTSTTRKRDGSMSAVGVTVRLLDSISGRMSTRVIGRNVVCFARSSCDVSSAGVWKSFAFSSNDVVEAPRTSGLGANRSVAVREGTALVVPMKEADRRSAATADADEPKADTRNAQRQTSRVFMVGSVGMELTLGYLNISTLLEIVKSQVWVAGILFRG